MKKIHETPPAGPAQDRTLHIYLKAAQVFYEKGFDATSMDDLAKALQITKAGLYYYIKSKEDLLCAIMNFAMDWLENEVLAPARAEADPEERLRLIIQRHGRMLMEGPRALPILSDEVRGLAPRHRKRILERKRAYYDLVRDTLEELKAKGKLQDVDPAVGAFGLFGTLLWLPRWFEPLGRLPSEQALADITTFIRGGLLKRQCNGLVLRGHTR
jgi:AcrR family transcriptional regulator